MAQTHRVIEDVTADLASAGISEKEVSFAGKGLKLDKEEDAKDVVEAVKSCSGMTSLCLEGNTIGCDAAKAIAKALEGQPKLKRALWKDMFTGRLKTEIPKALNYLSSGVMLSGAKLVELDLSDNAFGPVGVEGIASLLSSPCCHSLQELRLNNNGLGPHGGKILARALQDCLNGSRSVNASFTLRIFVCGRNRLENEGAQALATVFQALGSLEEVAMPQNGIYHQGISALASALSHNVNLKVVNFNDNTFTEEGARAFSVALGSLQKLEVINFGDCLVRSLGASFLCDALRDGHTLLKELHLSNNEIGKEEGIAIAEAMDNKPHLQHLELNGNCFGREGRELIEGTLEAIGASSTLGSLSDDEGEDEEDDDEDYRESDEQESQVVPDDESEQQAADTAYTSPLKKQVTATSFYACPSVRGLQQLGDDREQLLLAALGDNPTQEQYVEAFMKISSVADENEIRQLACECADMILMAAFSVVDKDLIPSLTNTLLVHLGLIKCEDKKFQAASDICGALIVLEHAVQQNYFHSSTLDVLQFFLSRPNNLIPVIPPKYIHALLTALYHR